jgi:hypothetical protein
MKIAANTKSDEVIDKLNTVLRTGKYASSSDFALRVIRRECEQVRSVDPARGWSLLGCYHSLLGEADEVDRCFKASQDLRNISIACDNYHTNLTNLGYFSRAHEFFKARATPESGMFSLMANVAFTSGSFQTFLAFYDGAMAMNMEMPVLPVERARRVAAVLSKAGVSDEQVTQHLDAAGVVLRKHKFFFADDGEIEVADEPGVFSGVTCIFRVNQSAEEVFELNMELSAAEDEMNVERSPAFDVLFFPA